MLATYDADPISALTVALRRVTGEANASFAELVAMFEFSPPRQALLAGHDQPALDELVRELNELRTVSVAPATTTQTSPTTG